MVKIFLRQSLALFALSIALSYTSVAQNSLLVNFGTSSCSGSGEPAFSLIKNPLTDSTSSLITCSMANQVPDIFAVFVAYNPKNNKIYIADIRTFTETKIWVLDIGLPENITCPSLLDSTPDYTYSYVSNNFEFDNNGDLWSFSNYNDTIGQCKIDKFDVTTGNIINTRTVQFPAGNFPASITSGDITILPNGRMFATLGSFPSRLYEIKNYNTSTNATATFLDSLPQSCYGIAYLNGQLEITGTDFSGNCYYYKYDIATNVLDSVKNFQEGQLPIDNTSITPSIGVTKQLVNMVKVNDNTADLTYEIYVRNLGNVALNNINVSDNLAAVYGAGNVSNINVSFVPGDNAANLVLNPSYNGSTDTSILLAGQNLNNETSVNTDYFLKLRLSFRVTNLNPAATYMNSAVGSATIGSMGTLSFSNVADSSNNGPESAVDPNNNGNATEPGENTPTPFNFSTLPVRFISINVLSVDKTSAMVKWTVATPTVSSDKFEIEYSVDGRNFKSIGELKIDNSNQGSYSFLHKNIPGGNLFYRVKETDIDGKFVYSSIVVLHNKNAPNSFIIYPNPVNNNVTITSTTSGIGKTQILLYDAVGRQLSAKIMSSAIEDINTASLPAGTYVLKVDNNGTITTQKILIIHK
ncbi:T9SS type A sorting domain-containing protein [Ginsengibacter hankyongi]|uniref:T9SS type A sorting domain-containing protein n=1 Tax=Ginsengibacter hankyongi TaxID=2607284 RepID=A0A5J5IC09_9BACT|nr:T9SS type A sorting domain-containing protein [Ginsengibacter hankyongi]KAA9035879.1 T9SS type A sorting domain-containing protein [Ginsengibacter hankyongi]